MKKYHYVYKITNLNPTDERQYYIGVRSCDCLPDEDIKYWSSSKSLKESIKEYGQNNFIKEILSVWYSREEAISEEIRLHEEFFVSINESFYNRSKQTSKKFDTSGLSWLDIYGLEGMNLKKKKLSELNSKKIGHKNPMFGKESHNKNKKMSDEQKTKLSNNRKNKSYNDICKSEDSYKKAIEAKLKKNNPKSRSIELYDDSNNLIIKVDTVKDFQEYCQQNNLPSRLYSKNNKEEKQIYLTTKVTPLEYRKYNFWYTINKLNRDVI